MIKKSILPGLVAIGLVGFCTMAAVAQTTSPAPQAVPAAPAPQAVPAAPPAAAAAAPTAPAPQETKPAMVASVARPHPSRCAMAIRATEKKLEKSESTPEKISSAWRFLEEAKKSRGKACEVDAREASDLL